MPELVINGKERSFAEGDFPETIAEMLSLLGLNPEGIVAEVGGKLIFQKQFSECRLNPGDNLELMQMVGGG